MRDRLLKWCEYIFPKQADYQVVRQLDEARVLLHLRPTREEEFTWLLPFNEPAVRALMHEAKFQQSERAWKLLGKAASQYFKHCAPDTVVVPIPLSFQRRFKRGYNQVTEVLKPTLQDNPHLEMKTNVLFRKRNTAPQTSLDRDQRLINVADAFGVRHPRLLTGKHIIVVDDVATTGATLKAARIALASHHPASITLLALAH